MKLFLIYIYNMSDENQQFNDIKELMEEKERLVQ